MPGGFVVPPPGTSVPPQTGLNPVNEPSSLPPGVSAAAAPQSPINRVLQQHGVDPISATSLTSEALRGLLEQAGADVNDPALQSIISNSDVLKSLESDPSIRQAFIASMVQKYPKATPSYYTYDQALQDYGFAPPPSSPAGGAVGVGASIGLEGEKYQSSAKNPKAGNSYITDPTSGAIMYKNGVIADPNAPGSAGLPGAVFFPPNNAGVEGSPAWLQKIQQNWKADTILKWRKKLADLGYLDPATSRGKTIDGAMVTALQTYYSAKYLNYGKPIASGQAAGDTNPFQSAHILHPQIAQAVTQQYQQLFGDTPSKYELQSWTQFVQQMANRMQRQKDVSVSDAVSTASARASNIIQNSPDAQYVQNAAQENTYLHDSLSAAAAATAATI